MVALMLRSGLDFFKLSLAEIGKGLSLILGLSVIIFWWRGLHRGVWRYTSLTDLSRIAVAVTIVIALYAVLQSIWTGFEGLPRSSVPIAWGAGIFLLGASRLAWRMYHDRYLLERSSYPRLPVLLLGTDDGAEPFVRETTRRADSHESITGFVFLASSSAAVLLMAHSPHGMEEINRLLSSTLIGATTTDVAVFALLLVVTAGALVLRGAELVLLVMDHEMAEAVGVPVRLWNGVIAVWRDRADALAAPALVPGCARLPHHGLSGDDR